MAVATWRLLTVDEVAKALRLSRTTVYNLIRSGVLPGTYTFREPSRVASAPLPCALRLCVPLVLVVALAIAVLLLRK